MQTALEFIHVSLAIGIVFSCFCKLTQTDLTTTLLLRVAIYAEAFAALALVFAVIFWGMPTNIWICLLMASIIGRSYSTKKVWENGVPFWAKKTNQQLSLF